MIHILVVKPPAQGGTGTFGKVVAGVLGSLSALVFMISVIGISVADDPVELMTVTGESVQTETQQTESVQPKPVEGPPDAAAEREQEPKPPFEPSVVIGLLQRPQFCAEAANVQWQRHDLRNGLERWLGNTPDDALLFEITPEWLYVMGATATPILASNTALAFGELASIALPDDYEEVNQEIMPKLLERATTEVDSEQSTEFNGWLLEMQGHTVLVTVSYKISRLPKK